MEGYRLAPVRALRERDEHAKKSDLAGAVDDVREADAALAAASAKVATLREALCRTAPPTTIAQAQRAERYRERTRSQLERALLDELHAKQQRDGVAATADAARDRLAIARAGRRAVEEHFGRWREAQRKLAERRED